MLQQPIVRLLLQSKNQTMLRIYSDEDHSQALIMPGLLLPRDCCIDIRGESINNNDLTRFDEDLVSNIFKTFQLTV